VAISQPTERDRIVNEVRAMWETIDAIQFEDGTIIEIDLRWLNGSLSKRNPNLSELRDRIQAMVALAADSKRNDKTAVMAVLERILKDPRFNYPDVTSTPIPSPTPQQRPPEPENRSASDNTLVSDFAQFILLVGGIVAAVVLLIYFARNLRVQPAQIPLPIEEDDPTTSEAALERASTLEGTQDYRTAIRYLYLSSLLLLDERNVMRYDSTLTNREHLQRIGHKPELRDALRPVVETFDEVWYGFAPVNEALYQQFRQNVERLHHITP
jgi:hypothetical protein